MLYVLFYLALFGYLQSFSDYGLNLWDEGAYINGTLRTFNGEQAIKDFNPVGYPPGQYEYGALFFKLFGVNIQSLRLGVALLTPTMVLLVYATARRLMPVGFALLSALFMLSAPGLYFARFSTLIGMINLYCLVRLIEKKSIRQLALLTGALILALYFKIEVAIYSAIISVPFILHIFFEGQREHLIARNAKQHLNTASISPFGVSMFISVAVYCALYLIIPRPEGGGNIMDIAVHVMEFHRAWSTPFPALFPFFEILKQIGPLRMFEHILFYLPVIIYIIAAVLLVRRFLQRNRKGWSTSDLQIAAILFFGICAYTLVLWRAGFTTLLRTLPPFYILICYLLHLARLQAAAHRWGSAFLRHSINAITLLFALAFFYDMNFRHGFDAGTIGAIKADAAHLKMDRVDLYTDPYTANWVENIVKEIGKYTREGEPILVFPFNPIFYFLGNRPNPTPYEWVLPGNFDNSEIKIVEKLKTKMPKLVIYTDLAIDGKNDRRFSQYAPILFKFISDHYQQVKVVGIFEILLPVKSLRPS